MAIAVEDKMLTPTPMKTAYAILRSIILVVVICFLIRLYWFNRKFIGALNKLPNLRMRFYHVFGHISIVLKHHLFPWKYPTAPHVYDLMAIDGYLEIFNHESVANLWQSYVPLVFVYKASSVEVILNHSTELQKSWIYKFLMPWLGSGLLTSKGEKWRSRRKLLTPAFHFNILKDFVPVFNKQTKVMVDVLQNHTEDKFVDIVPVVTRCSFDIICESILGAEMHTQTKGTTPYMESVHALTRIVYSRMYIPWTWSEFVFKKFPAGKKWDGFLKVVHDLAEELIRKMKEEKLQKKKSETTPKEGANEEAFIRNKRALLDLLLDEHLNSNSISLTEIRDEVDTFMFEGHDTTAMGMSWALYLIGLYPDVQKKLQAELDSIFGKDDRDVTMDDLRDMKYLECVLKESLRLYPSVPAYGRHLIDDIEIEGHVIPKGTTCMVYAPKLHRDPEFFPNPEVFDPERFTPENSAGRHPFAFVPFSAGPRNCIGQRFALMEEKTVVSAILRKCQIHSLDQRDAVHAVAEVVLRPCKGLRIEIRSRNPES